MTLLPHTRQTLLTLVLLMAFGLSAYGAYSIMVTPFGYKTTEGFNRFPNGTKASVSDSVTVLSLADKSPEQVADLPQKNNVSLCASFPRRVSTYELFTTKITNVASEEGHTSYYDVSSKKLVSIHPNERIELEYIPTAYDSKEKVKPTNITARVFRYTAESDLIAEFGDIFNLQYQKPIESKVLTVSGVQGKERYVYKNGSTVIEVVGQKLADIKRVAEQIGGACESKPVFDSGVPKGFVSWRTTDNTREDRIAYVKIADADLTLNLETIYFGNEIRVADNTTANNLGVSEWIPTEKFRLFSIPTLDAGKLQMSKSVHMFVAKNSDIRILLNAIENRQKELFNGTLQNVEKSTYESPRGTVGKNIYTYVRTDEKGDTSTVYEHIYVLSRKNTAFVFVYNHDNIEVVESLINNLK